MYTGSCNFNSGIYLARLKHQRTYYSVLATVINSVLRFKYVNYSVPGYSEVFSCSIFSIDPLRLQTNAPKVFFINCKLKVAIRSSNILTETRKTKLAFSKMYLSY